MQLFNIRFRTFQIEDTAEFAAVFQSLHNSCQNVRQILQEIDVVFMKIATVTVH